MFPKDIRNVNSASKVHRSLTCNGRMRAQCCEVKNYAQLKLYFTCDCCLMAPPTLPDSKANCQRLTNMTRRALQAEGDGDRRYDDFNHTQNTNIKGTPVKLNTLTQNLRSGKKIT
ncbi:hypothetical protein T265_16290, partial [Opisthorchis viverrini]